MWTSRFAPKRGGPEFTIDDASVERPPTGHHDRRTLRLGLLAGAVLVLVVAGGIVAYNVTRPDVTLERQTLEAAITDWAKDDLGAEGYVQVTCPDEPSGDVGDTFHCIVEDLTGSIRVTVTIEDEDGTVTWVAA